MRLTIRSMVAFTALGLAGVTAGGVAGAEQATHPTEEQAPTPARTPHGFVQIIGESLSEVTLRPDQEAAVEELSKQVEPLEIKVDDAENALLLALADQVAAGKISRDALESEIAAYATARQEVSGELRSAFERLHDLFDAQQREDFADALESRVHDVRLAILDGERLDDLSQQLELTEAQKQKILEDLQAIAPMLEHQRVKLHEIVEAFRGDTFSVEELLPQSQVPERARLRAERIIDLTATFAGVLDAAQREKLAARIREAAQARGDEPGEGEPTGPAEHEQGEEHAGHAAQHVWVAGGVRRGPFGGVRGGVVVGGARGFAFRRTRAFPVAAGWGYGW